MKLHRKGKDAFVDIQHTAALMDADFIVAVNKNLDATMMKLADVAIVADANQVCSGIIRALKEKTGLILLLRPR